MVRRLGLLRGNRTDISTSWRTPSRFQSGRDVDDRDLRKLFMSRGTFDALARQYAGRLRTEDVADVTRTHQVHGTTVGWNNGFLYWPTL